MPAEPRAVRPRPPAPCSGLRDDRLSEHGADVKTKNTGDSITGMMRSMTQEEMLELCWIDKWGRIISRHSPEQRAELG